MSFGRTAIISELSLSIMWQAGRQAPGVCVYIGSAWKWISPHYSHLSYQSANVLPPRWRNTFTTLKNKCASSCVPRSSSYQLMQRADRQGEETASCDTPAAGFSGCTFFKLAECVCWGGGGGVSRVGGGHGGTYKYSEGTCCIPSLLILLTFPYRVLNHLSFNLI